MLQQVKVSIELKASSARRRPSTMRSIKHLSARTLHGIDRIGELVNLGLTNGSGKPDIGYLRGI
jgi:hypothetical protein